MKIEIDNHEQAMLITSMNTHIAALKRAANTEQDKEIKEMRERAHARFNNLKNKLITGEIFNETPISKQK